MATKRPPKTPQEFKAPEDLNETIPLGIPTPPGGGPYVIPTGPPTNYSLKANSQVEYLAGGSYPIAPLGDYVRTLPEWIDPLEQDFGLDIYQRMIASDPQVASCVELYKTAVLADGWRLTPAKDIVNEAMSKGRIGEPPQKASSDEAIECAEFCEWALNNISKTPFDLFLRQMLEAIIEGHKIAEIVMKVQETGPFAGRLVFDRLKVKPHRTTAFVMDAYDNLIGILGILPNVPFYGMWPGHGFLAGNGLTLLPGAGPDALQKDVPSLLPLTKFAILTFDGMDSNPQGRSLLRRVFTPWWWKENAYAIWGKFITKHADPTLIGTAAEKGISIRAATDPITGLPMLDAQGNPVMMTPVDELGQQLALVQNGSWLALPFGSTCAPIPINTNGEAIEKFKDFCNDEIAKGILGTTLSTQEGQSGTGSYAQSKTHEHAKDDVTRYGQILLTSMVLRQLLKLLVDLNYGPDSEEWIPRFGLGQEETLSFVDFAAGAAQLGFTVHTSQFPGMDDMAGLPPRNLTEWQGDLEEQKANEQAQQQALQGGGQF